MQKKYLRIKVDNMSHSIKITLSNIQPIITQCDNYIISLNKMLNSDWNFDISFKNDIQNKINNINKIKESTLKKMDSLIDVNEQTYFSSLSKEITNIKNTINFKKMILETLNKNEINLDKNIAKYGTMAIDVINSLKAEGTQINDESFANKLQIIRTQEVDKESLKKYTNISNKIIDDSHIPEEIKYELKKMIRSYKTSQEVSDINPYLEYKKQEYDLVVFNAKNVSKSLLKLDFSKTGNTEWKMNDDQVMSVTLSFVNKSNNTVKIKFDGDGNMNYKLGNYIGHACEKTTELLEKDLYSQGYVYLNKQIKRDIDDSKPLFKEMKILERGK